MLRMGEPVRGTRDGSDLHTVVLRTESVISDIHCCMFMNFHTVVLRTQFVVGSSFEDLLIHRIIHSFILSFIASISTDKLVNSHKVDLAMKNSHTLTLTCIWHAKHVYQLIASMS